MVVILSFFSRSTPQIEAKTRVGFLKLVGQPRHFN